MFAQYASADSILVNDDVFQLLFNADSPLNAAS